jgi:hypothetical protein
MLLRKLLSIKIHAQKPFLMILEQFITLKQQIDGQLILQKVALQF